MCAMKVDPSDPGFAAAVLDALARIAPGYRFWADAEGRVSCSPVFCLLYNRHRAGCNLVREILSADGEIRVSASNNKNGSSFARLGPEAGTAYWWPGTYDGIYSNGCGTGDAPGPVVLAHELVHALFFLRRRTFGTASKEEEVACRAENQIRAELCEPRRASYGDGGNGITVSGSGGLSQKNEEGCGRGTGVGSRAWKQDCRRRIKEICKIYQAHQRSPKRRIPPTPSTPYAPEVTDPALEERFLLANDARERSEELAEVERYLERTSLLPGRARSILITSAGLAGGCGFVAIELWQPGKGSAGNSRPRLTVTTNFCFGAGEPGGDEREPRARHRMYASGPNNLTRYVADPERAEKFTAYFDPILDKLGLGKHAKKEASESLGGDPNVFDGTAEFLTLRQGTREVVKVGLTGYSFPAFHRDWRAPAASDVENRFRWVAIDTAYLLARDLLIERGPEEAPEGS